MIIGIPTNDGKMISNVFGRCEKIAIYDTSANKLEIFDNSENAKLPGGAGINTSAAFLQHNVNKIVTIDFGPKAKDVFKDKPVEIVMIKNVISIDEIIKSYK